MTRALLALVFVLVVLANPGIAVAVELSIRLDAGDEAAPGQVCLDLSPMLKEAVKRLFGKDSTKQARFHEDHGLCAKDSCTSCAQRPKTVTLEVAFTGSDTPPTISDLELSGDTVRLKYLKNPAPQVVTVKTREGHHHDYYADTAVVWSPPLGSAPVVLQLVPQQVERRMALPEYECPAVKASASPVVEIDRNWAVTAGAQTRVFPGCQGDEDVVKFEMKPMASARRKEDALPVLIRKFSFSWAPHCLSDAPQERDAVKLVANDRAVSCKTAEWQQDRFRFECEAPGAALPVTTFPIALTLASKGGDGTVTWTEVLHHPGETLRGFVPASERSLIVKWPEEWEGRAAWQADRIHGVRLVTAAGDLLRLHLPDTSKPGWGRERYPMSGLECGQAFALRLDGDRSFHEQTIELGVRPPAASASARRVGSELDIPVPIDRQRSDGQRVRRDSLGLGGRLAGGVAGYGRHRAGDSRNGWTPAGRRRYFTELGELELYTVFRGDRPDRGHRHDWLIGAFGTYFKWPSYRWDLGSTGQSRTRSNSHRAVLLGLDFGFERSFTNTLRWGLAATIGEAVAVRRARVDTVPSRPFTGLRASALWYLGRAVALDLALRGLLVDARFTRLDLNGIGDTWTVAQPSGWVSLGLRVDDLIGD